MRVVPVTNEFFGDQVTVSGLLTGQDVRRSLECENSTGGAASSLPRAMFDDAGRVTLDDWTLHDIGVGLPVELTPRRIPERPGSQSHAPAVTYVP